MSTAATDGILIVHALLAAAATASTQLCITHLHYVLAAQSGRRVTPNNVYESVRDGTEPVGHPFTVTRAIPRIVVDIQLIGCNIHRDYRLRKRRQSVSVQVQPRYLKNHFPVEYAVCYLNAGVADIQNGRVDEVVATSETTKKTVVGEVQFVFGITLRQLGQLKGENSDVRIGTINM